MGLEAQASWSHLRKGENYIDPNTQPFSDPDHSLVVAKRLGDTIDNLGTIAGRIGYAFDRWLAYGKGGAAWARNIDRVLDADLPAEPLLASATHTRWGWMVGAGLEYGLTANWSAKIEYDYLDFGTERVTVISVTGVTPPTHAFDIKQNISLVKVGINYRFGGGPVIAKY